MARETCASVGFGLLFRTRRVRFGDFGRRDVLALGRGRVGLLDGDTAVAVGIGLSGGGGGFGLLDGDALGAVGVSFARDGGGFGLLDGDTPLTVGVCLA